MKTAGVSRSACSPWCPAPGQRRGPARTSWLAPSVSSSRRRASARSGAEMAGDLAGRGFAGPGQKRIRPWTLASGATWPRTLTSAAPGHSVTGTDVVDRKTAVL